MLKELGTYKDRIYSLFSGDDILCQLLLGKNYATEVTDIPAALKSRLLPHPFNEAFSAEPGSYIFFETSVTKFTPAVKTMKILIQPVCHTDHLLYEPAPGGYSGLKYDMMAQAAEAILCPSDKILSRERMKQFGIGKPELQTVESLVAGSFIGRTMTFTVPDFR